MALNNKSLHFNPSSTQVSYAKLGTAGLNPSIKGLSDFTWMAWVKSDRSKNTTLRQRLYVERTGQNIANGVRFGVVPSKDRLRFELTVKDGDNKTNYDYLFDWNQAWHHIAFVAKISGTTPTYEIYFDGTKVADGTLRKTSGIDAVSNTAPLHDTCFLGNVNYAKTGTTEYLVGNQWYGKVDELYLFKSALGQSDIQSYIASRNVLATSDPDMLSYWDFEGSGTTEANKDSPTWVATFYQYTAGGTETASALARATDRPFLGVSGTGTGPVDTTAPGKPTLAAGYAPAPTTDSFLMSINIPTDNINVNTIEFQVAELTDFSSYVTYTVPFAFSTATTLTLPIADLTPGVNYFWRARAIDEALNVSSNWTAGEVQNVATFAVTTIPKSPSLVLGSASYDNFKITLTATPQDVNGNPITIAGFKVDIAYDAAFSRFVSGWKNKDVGNSTINTPTGLSELTTYFVRARQYVADGTESVSSTPATVQTSSAPDETPPLPVDAEDATSIDSRSATLNWVEGQDNIGVVDYLLDVATDNVFSQQFVSGLSVGNVTSYRQVNLQPNTAYFYRVRAVDGAGLISPNSTVIGQFTTLSAGIEDGGFVTVDRVTDADTWVQSASPTSTSGGFDSQVFAAGNGATNTRNAYLQIDLRDIGSNPISAMLWLFNAQNTLPGGSITIQASSALTITEATTTWNNQPAVTGPSVVRSLPGSDQWVSVDVSSFITGPGLYLFKISTTANATYSFYAKDVSSGPGLGKTSYVSVEYDPSIQIKPDQIIVSAGPSEYTNLCVNPNAESNVTTGWTATTSNTLSIDATNGVNGGKVFKNVQVSAATNPIGMQTTTPLTVSLGDVIFVSGYAKSASGDQTIKVYCQGLTAANAVVNTTTLNAIAKPGDHTPFIGYYSVTDPTVVKVRITLGGTQNTAATVYFDNIVFWRDSVLKNTGLLFGLGAYYDGTVGGGDGYWSGTGNLSSSVRYGASMNVLATYLGDSNMNASATAYLKRSQDVDWISVYQSLTMYGDSANNQFQTLLGPTFGSYNLLRNPSFEVDTSGWSVVSGLGSSVLTKFDEDADVGMSCGKVVTNATANIGVKSQRVFLSSYADDAQHARAAVKIPAGSRVGISILAYNSANTVIGTSTDVLGETMVDGNDDWQDVTVAYTLPALTYSYEVQLLQKTAVAATWYVDAVLAGDGPHVNPYRDGTFADAYFEGTAHDSVTALVILPNEPYDIRIAFTDPDGVIDQSGTTADLTATYRTSPAVDNRTIFNEYMLPLVIAKSADRISFDLPFQGDDNTNMTARVEYKRSDHSSWQLTQHTVDRSNKAIHADVVNLNPGTLYMFRITVTDPDGVNGLAGNEKVFQAATEYYGVNITTPSVITFGGYLLHDESRSTDLKTFVISHDAFGFPERRIDIQDIPKMDGAVELDAFWGTRTIKMRGIVFGNSRNEVMGAIDQMKLGLLGRQQPLVINTYSNTNRRYLATCKSLVIEEGEENFRHLEWDATFECADPFAYSADLKTYGPVQVDLRGDPNTSQITLTNAGALETLPLITITTKSSSRITPSLTATLTSERIVPEKGMVTDDSVVIDTASQSVLMNGVDIGYTGTFPKLYPGSNVWRFDAYRGPTQRNVYVTVQWRERFI